MKRKNRCFTLKNIDPIELFSRYEFYDYIQRPEIQTTNLNLEDDDISIVDLMHEKNKRVKKCVHFLDSSKSRIKYWINMFDLTSNNLLPRYTKSPCWYCRESFTTHPIGCPIRYYVHDTSGKIKELCQRNNISIDSDDKLSYFETEGIFCTFPCIKSYIIQQLAITKSPIYRQALTFLTLMYYIFYGINENIPLAPTWRIGVNYGGHLTAVERRATVGKLEYDETVNFRRPYMLPINQYICETEVKN